jgi:hypothetical protein
MPTSELIFIALDGERRGRLEEYRPKSENKVRTIEEATFLA